MKKILVFLITLSFTFLFCTVPISARAGGGENTGSSGNTECNESSRNSTDETSDNFYGPYSNHHTTHTDSVKSGLIIIFSHLFIWYTITIIKKQHIIKAKIKTKYYMKENKIDYKCIKKRIADTYFVVQNAWANSNMSLASTFMTPELIEKFNIKLNWMSSANKKNVMEKIKLLAGDPISLDHINKDKMWVYIRGKMIDYTINSRTNEVISGSSISRTFIEFWLFIKNENNEWVLSQILQEDEFNRTSL